MDCHQTLGSIVWRVELVRALVDQHAVVVVVELVVAVVDYVCDRCNWISWSVSLSLVVVVVDCCR